MRDYLKVLYKLCCIETWCKVSEHLKYPKPHHQSARSAVHDNSPAGGDGVSTNPRTTLPPLHLNELATKKTSFCNDQNSNTFKVFVYYIKSTAYRFYVVLLFRTHCYTIQRVSSVPVENHPERRRYVMYAALGQPICSGKALSFFNIPRLSPEFFSTLDAP